MPWLTCGGRLTSVIGQSLHTPELGNMNKALDKYALHSYISIMIDEDDLCRRAMAAYARYAPDPKRVAISCQVLHRGATVHVVITPDGEPAACYRYNARGDNLRLLPRLPRHLRRDGRYGE